MDEFLNVAEQYWHFPSGAKAVGRRALKWGGVRADPTIKQGKFIRESSTIRKKDEHGLWRIAVRHTDCGRARSPYL